MSSGALTCGEKTTYAFNGTQWHSKNRPDEVSAAFALNESGGGLTDGHGNLVSQLMEVGEKAVQNYLLKTVNIGGHRSIPPCWTNDPWLANLNQMASGNPGAVQFCGYFKGCRGSHAGSRSHKQ